MKFFIYLFKNESGQSMTEYALTISLIFLLVLSAVHALGLKVDNLYSYITSKLPF